jgi:hypothetical protein
MATVGEIETHQPSVRRHDGLVDLEVGRAAAEALNIDSPLLGVKVESRESTILAERLNLINVLVSAIVAGAGVALRVLVGHGGAEGVEDGAGCDILGGNKDDGLALALDFMFLGKGKHGGFPVGNKKRTMISATSGSESTNDFSRSCEAVSISPLVAIVDEGAVTNLLVGLGERIGHAGVAVGSHCVVVGGNQIGGSRDDK